MHCTTHAKPFFGLKNLLIYQFIHDDDTVFSLIPKENATVSIINRFCFEMARQITLPIELN
jgi:hypothetical protein